MHGRDNSVGVPISALNQARAIRPSNRPLAIHSGKWGEHTPQQERTATYLSVVFFSRSGLNNDASGYNLAG